MKLRDRGNDIRAKRGGDLMRKEVAHRGMQWRDNGIRWMAEGEGH